MAVLTARSLRAAGGTPCSREKGVGTLGGETGGAGAGARGSRAPGRWGRAWLVHWVCGGGPGGCRPSGRKQHKTSRLCRRSLVVGRMPRWAGPVRLSWPRPAPVLQVHGAPGGQSRVGLRAQPAGRPRPPLHAAPRRGLRPAVRLRLPLCPGRRRGTRAGGHTPCSGLRVPGLRGTACLGRQRESRCAEASDSGRGTVCSRPAVTRASLAEPGVHGAAGSASTDGHRVGASCRHEAWLSWGRGCRRGAYGVPLTSKVATSSTVKTR